MSREPLMPAAAPAWGADELRGVHRAVEAMKRCHFCREEIPDAAIVCTHCGRGLTATVKSTTLTKPAGLFLQLIGAGLLFGGGVFALGSIAEGGFAQVALGIAILLGGFALLRVGRRPRRGEGR